MNARALLCTAFGSAILVASPAWSGTVQEPPLRQTVSYAAPSTGCALPSDQEAHPMTQRAEMLSQFERMPSDCLKSVVMQCGQVANRAFLDMGSAALCSLSYEALLRSGFNGNFQALVAWWQTVRVEASAQ